MGWLDAWLLYGLAAVAAGFDAARSPAITKIHPPARIVQPTSLSGAVLTVLAIEPLHSS
jgi:hypothetical protein